MSRCASPRRAQLARDADVVAHIRSSAMKPPGRCSYRSARRTRKSAGERGPSASCRAADPGRTPPWSASCAAGTRQTTRRLTAAGVGRQLVGALRWTSAHERQTARPTRRPLGGGGTPHRPGGAPQRPACRGAMVTVQVQHLQQTETERQRTQEGDREAVQNSSRKQRQEGGREAAHRRGRLKRDGTAPGKSSSPAEETQGACRSRCAAARPASAVAPKLPGGGHSPVSGLGRWAARWARPAGLVGGDFRNCVGPKSGVNRHMGAEGGAG